MEKPKPATERTDAFGRRVAANPNEVWVDHDTGIINIPGRKPLPLVGDPASGDGYRWLKHQDQEYNGLDKLEIQRYLRSVWRCEACGKIPGRLVRGTWDFQQHCIPNPRCGNCGCVAVIAWDAKWDGLKGGRPQ